MKLEARSGFLGAHHLPSSEHNVHALALRDSTMKVLWDMACPPYGMPLCNGSRTAYTKFLKVALPKIELLCADGASDEQLALDFMFRIFPALKVATRDVCHSIRRVASRTSVADPYCKRVLLDSSEAMKLSKL